MEKASCQQPPHVASNEYDSLNLAACKPSKHMGKSWPQKAHACWLTRHASQCTSFALAGILALYKRSARRSQHFPTLSCLSASITQLIQTTIKICTMARMAAVAFVFASIAGVAVAQGTTCADPTVLPGNVSPQDVILLL